MVSEVVGTTRGLVQGVVLNFSAFSLHWFTAGFALFSCFTEGTMASSSKMDSPSKSSSCSSPSQSPGKRDRKANDGGPFGNRVIGINLRNLRQFMTTSMRQTRVDHMRQNMGRLPKTKDKNFYWQSLNSDWPSFLWHHFGDK